MSDFPIGYALFYLSDEAELIAPTGQIVGKYDPETPTARIIKDAWEHRKRSYICDDPTCWVCQEKLLA